MDATSRLSNRDEGVKEVVEAAALRSWGGRLEARKRLLQLWPILRSLASFGGVGGATANHNRRLSTAAHRQHNRKIARVAVTFSVQKSSRSGVRALRAHEATRKKGSGCYGIKIKANASK